MKHVLAYGRIYRRTGPSGVEIVFTQMTSVEADKIKVSTRAHRVDPSS